MLNRKLSYCVLLFILALVVACGGKKEESEESAPAPSASTPAAGGNTYDASKATATVTGKINFEGAKPTPAKLP